MKIASIVATISSFKDVSIWGIIGGLIIACFHYLYGDSEVVYAVMTLILILIAGDWLSGSRASEKDDTYASEYGLGGIKRTAFILLLPAIGHLIDKITGLPGLVFGIFSAGIAYHILKSVTANVVRAGWEKWVPNLVIEWVASEIEHKVARAMQRKQEREEKIKMMENNRLPNR